MVNGTFTSDQKKAVEQKLDRLNTEYGVVIDLVEVIGRRWSYLAGKSGDDVALMPVQRLELTGSFGAVIYTPQLLDGTALDALREKLNGMLKGLRQ